MEMTDEDLGHDLGNLVRRLRRFGQRWPQEEATAEMCREAADELTRLVAEAGRLKVIAEAWDRFWTAWCGPRKLSDLAPEVCRLRDAINESPTP